MICQLELMGEWLLLEVLPVVPQGGPQGVGVASWRRGLRCRHCCLRRRRCFVVASLLGGLPFGVGEPRQHFLGEGFIVVGDTDAGGGSGMPWCSVVLKRAAPRALLFRG